MSIKVAIVEDDSKVREGLPFIINVAAGFCCTAAYPNAEVALKQMPHQWPDIVLMDINLPEMSGIKCADKLKELRPALQIVMLTAHEDEDLIFESLMSGASGYLLKRTPPAEIIEALRDVHNGGSPMTSSIARKVVLHFRQQKRGNDDAKKLSDREAEIVTLLAKGYQYKEIAEQLSISPLTVRSHLRRIYEKLHVRTRTEAVMKFFGNRPQ